MLSFFRKIRQNLLLKEKTGKPSLPAGRYIKYAIGEILLVVIGILIALSVNNYNQNLENRKDELIYLKGIRFDLQTQISNFEQIISLNERRISIANLILDDYVKNGQLKRNDSILFLINQITSVSAPTGIKTTFTELLTSGDMNLIRNNQLKSEIVRFYQELEVMVEKSKTNLTTFLTHSISILDSRTIVGSSGSYNNFLGNLSVDLPDRSYPAHLKEAAYKKYENPELALEFINALNLKTVIEILQKDRAKIIIESARQLIEQIEIELREQHKFDPKEEL